MLAIIKQPGEPAKRIEIDNTLEALQRAVGGYIETVSIFTDVTLICNEEGRLMGLPYNMDFAGIRFVGPVLVVGRTEDDFRSLTDEEFTAIMRRIFKQISLPKTYRDARGWLYRVMPGLGGNTYKGRYQQPGKLSWHCMRQLPWKDNQIEAVADLEMYAAAHKWKEVTGV